MSDFEVTWQMTRIVLVNAADELEAKTIVESWSDPKLLAAHGNDPVTQVIAVRTVE